MSIRLAAGRGRGRGNAILLLPGAAGSAGLGLLAGESPIAGAAVGGFTMLAMLPWGVVFGLFVSVSLLNRWTYNIGGSRLQPADLILLPLALRVFLMTRDEVRLRWRWPEWALVAFIAVQFLTSYLNAVNHKQSIQASAHLMLEAVAYLATYTALCTRERLIFAARVVLVALATGAGIGVLAFISHYTVGTGWGVSPSTSFGVGARGLAAEHDILGSLSGAAAIAFLILKRERNPLFSRRGAAIGFAVSFGGLLVSLARGSWVGFAVVYMLLFVMRGRRSRRVGPERVAALVVVLVLAVYGGFKLVTSPDTSSSTSGLGTSAAVIATRSSQLVNFGAGSGANRLVEWKTALGEVSHSPLIGLGTNSYGQRHFVLKDGVPIPGWLGNLYVRTLYDSGVIGLLLRLLFLGSVLIPAGRMRRSLHELSPVARAMLFGYGLMAIAFAATDASLQTLPWVILGVGRAAYVLAKRGEPEQPGSAGDSGADGGLAVRPTAPLRNAPGSVIHTGNGDGTRAMDTGTNANGKSRGVPRTSRSFRTDPFAT